MTLPTDISPEIATCLSFIHWVVAGGQEADFKHVFDVQFELRAGGRLLAPFENEQFFEPGQESAGELFTSARSL